jgi:phospholipid/cholesterol/gamma-HCH transport system permease protein
MTAEQGLLDTTSDGGVLILAAAGSWTLTAASALARILQAVPLPPADGVGDAHPGQPGRIRLDLGRLENLDTVGALLLRQFRDRLLHQGHPVLIVNVRPEHIALIEAVWRAAEVEPPPPETSQPLREAVEALGQASLKALRATVELISFFGQVCTALLRVLIHPRRLRLTALVYHMDHTGLRCLPILGLLSFLIGVVLAYQGAEQLRRLGAEIYVVNLLGLSILREIGILITAIIVAGRSGSAFTAQIGTMKVNQEIDALRTLGLDPMELLVVPRILALMLVMPLLTFYANMIALFGGAVMSYLLLDINFHQFVTQMRIPIDFWDATVAMIKAPVFALVIGMVGCYEGLLVSGSAESVGLRTTKSVVESIFLVIVLNAFFSVLFSTIHI